MSREDNSLQFIQEIEKREHLYNFTLPEYARKDLTEKAWSEIGNIMGLTVTECKEKWRNIRSTFLRTRKPVDGKMKKRYYLHDDLQFIVPFIRPHQRTKTYTDSLEHPNYMDIEIDNAEEFSIEPQDESKFMVSDNQTTMTGSPKIVEQQTYAIESNSEQSHLRRRRKRDGSELEDTLVDYIKFKKQKASTSSNAQSAYTPIQHFFESLMPDIETMTEEQVRKFKIKVLFLINQIKSNKDDS